MNDLWDPFEGMRKPKNDLSLRNLSNNSDFYIMFQGKIFATESTMIAALAKAKKLGYQLGVRMEIKKKKGGV